MNSKLRYTGVSLLTGITCISGYQADAAKTKHSTKEQKPNILFILADDLGWRDLGCTGSQFYETPNIDGIAQRGVQFVNGYAACQVSSPSRASILTGKFTARHGITNWIGEYSGKDWQQMGRHSKLLPAEYVWSLPKEDITLAEALRSNGYKTFLAGKWHLGDKGSYPEDHGFDINVGGYEAGSPNGGYFTPYNNPKLKDGPKGENLSIRLANETASFIEKQSKENKKQPFFAYLSFYAVHAPLETSQEYWKHFRDKADSMGIATSGFKIDRTLPVRQVQDNPIYAGVIKQMDDAVGIVLNKLKKLGLDKNTIIVFTSDNGGVSSGDAYSTSNFPLRGGKGRQWEAGFRVPLLIQYPGCKNPGSTCDIPFIGTDFYPTFLDLASIPLNPKQHADGISMRPALNGEKMAERPLFWHYPHYGNQGGEPSSVVQLGKWKLIHYYENGNDELYNLEYDPTEQNPVNEQYPLKVTMLKNTLAKWLDSVNAKMPSADPEYDAAKEGEVIKYQNNEVLMRQEKTRLKQLSPDFKPNANWWGSVTKD